MSIQFQIKWNSGSWTGVHKRRRPINLAGSLTTHFAVVRVVATGRASTSAIQSLAADKRTSRKLHSMSSRVAFLKIITFEPSQLRRRTIPRISSRISMHVHQSEFAGQAPGTFYAWWPPPTDPDRAEITPWIQSGVWQQRVNIKFFAETGHHHPGHIRADWFTSIQKWNVDVFRGCLRSEPSWRFILSLLGCRNGAYHGSAVCRALGGFV